MNSRKSFLFRHLAHCRVRGSLSWAGWVYTLGAEKGETRGECVSLQYELEDKILCFRFEAGTETEEIYGAVHTAYRDPACPRDASVLIDLKASTSITSRSLEGLRTLSQFMLVHPDRPGQRVAIVLSNEQLERTTSLAESLVEQTGIEIQLFSDGSAARTWLRAG